MLAIFKRELKAYFISPIGYIFIAVFLAASGFAFSNFTLKAGERSDVGMWFTIILLMFVILIPLLTMRLLSEERKLKTEQVILTAPVSLFGIVMGKFLAAYTIFATTFLVSSANVLVLFLYGTPNKAVIVGYIVSILLIGGAFIALGLFISAFTENQLTAAIVTIATIALLLAVGLITTYVDFFFIRVILDSLSVLSRFYYFTYGIFDVNAVIYYISLTIVFLFLTVRIYERRRWS